MTLRAPNRNARLAFGRDRAWAGHIAVAHVGTHAPKLPVMSDFTIYHNPRCTKSRETLALLEEHGVQPRIVEYLKTPPTAAELE